ncbi:uncharacterized protein K441DRAFT_684961 [Cenococcum geophilum 1.58]|uniref:uncharacterized protein n=1 Tax=Cenococcum geophilum 1.58 TaxID=794803 RepID=UPI00358F7081|nr:hypothetical protein K441DRAFT_684961 [Cenococcum geophilum 1.58]
MAIGKHTSSRLPLTFVCGLTDRMNALYTGEVQPEGIDLDFLAIHHPRDIFDRMLSVSEYITRHAAGDRTFIAIPALPSRTFRHGFIAVNDRMVHKPADLAGKKIGVQLYTVTAAWVKGAMETPQAYSQPSALPMPKPVSLARNSSGKSLSQLLEDGEIDATIGAASMLVRFGIFPIMHLVVLRREYYEKHRFAATSLFNALNESQEIAYKRMLFLGALQFMLQWLANEFDEIEEVFSGDPWPYGFLFKQGMTEKTAAVEEFFAPAK